MSDNIFQLQNQNATISRILYQMNQEFNLFDTCQVAASLIERATNF